MEEWKKNYKKVQKSWKKYRTLFIQLFSCNQSFTWVDFSHHNQQQQYQSLKKVSKITHIMQIIKPILNKKKNQFI